jgi:hypothetical protein
MTKKNQKNICNSDIMQRFSTDATIFKTFFFAHENMKKLPSKVVHNRSIFFSVLPLAAKIENSYRKLG